MPLLNKAGTEIDSAWQLLPEDATEIPSGEILVPYSIWEAVKGSAATATKVGVFLNSDQSPEALVADLNTLSLIAINFPVFSDGRGYSYAQRLRSDYGFKGEIRAVGDVLPDQLQFMLRCGFDSFAVRDDKGIDVCRRYLNCFSDAYQAAQDQPEPLFNRR